jgi:hypothetical protein
LLQVTAFSKKKMRKGEKSPSWIWREQNGKESSWIAVEDKEL